MLKLKDIDYRILSELLKNSKMSDRKLAKEIGVSQPTVTRRRARLEKEVINGYTTIPDWTKLGYEILAITLVKSKSAFSSKENYEAVRKQGIEWLLNQPNIIMGGGIEGMGMNSFIISFHKRYSDYNQFLHKLSLDLGSLIDDVQTLLVDLTAKDNLKPLHLKYLGEAIQPFR